MAYYAPGPVFNRGVGLEMAAILRNNFWLAIHVLIITASYGAGTITGAIWADFAWGRYWGWDPKEVSNPLYCDRQNPGINSTTIT